jgi:hypothetical protein
MLHLWKSSRIDSKFNETARLSAEVLGWQDSNPHHCQVICPFSIFFCFRKILRLSVPSDVS